MSARKNEPKWMLDLRLRALQSFWKDIEDESKDPSLHWGPKLSDLHIDRIHFYKEDHERATNDWEEVPENIKETFEYLGVPEGERKYLAGSGAQWESKSVYHSLQEKWSQKGIIFLDMDEAMQEHEDLVKQYFTKAVPYHDHRFMKLHTAVWSGGTFLYIPEGVDVTEPLQAYFRMNTESMGQFEHTMIIVEKGAKGHYIEGCSAPKWDSAALHAGCVEIFVHEGADVRYSSVENWSTNTYNLNTKRAVVDKGGKMEWYSGNLGSKTSMLYPMTILRGERAKTKHFGVSFANSEQNQDIGAKVLHAASHTSSQILSKSVSKGGGVATYRGLIEVTKGAAHCDISSECDGLLVDDISRSVAIPKMRIRNPKTFVSHEASVGKLSEEMLFYLQSRGISEDHAKSMLINGFLDPIVKELPIEYAAEMNKLVEYIMEKEGI